jgi:E3 ubiquitin-protein ligase TRIP12
MRRDSRHASVEKSQRADILKQAESVIPDFANSKALLEIQYVGEVGTGLGPTLEFYTLAKELQRVDSFDTWRGDKCAAPREHSDKAAGEQTDFYHCAAGLFPAALAKNVKMTTLNKIKQRFRFLGKFLAKVCMDSRMVDVPLSACFYKWMLGLAAQSLADVEHIDRTLHRSLAGLHQATYRAGCRNWLAPAPSCSPSSAASNSLHRIRQEQSGHEAPGRRARPCYSGQQ